MCRLDSIRRRTELMVSRIDESGILQLTMADIRFGVSFEEAEARDMKTSMLPFQVAAVVILNDGERSRVLKDRRSPQNEEEE